MSKASLGKQMSKNIKIQFPTSCMITFPKFQSSHFFNSFMICNRHSSKLNRTAQLAVPSLNAIKRTTVCNKQESYYIYMQELKLVINCIELSQKCRAAPATSLPMPALFARKTHKYLIFSTRLRQQPFRSIFSQTTALSLLLNTIYDDF